MGRANGDGAGLLPAGLLAALLSGGAASAQTEIPVEFPPGGTGTAVSGTVTGQDYVDHVLAVGAGQTMTATLNVTTTNGNGTAYFNVLPAGQDFPALYNGSTDDDRTAEVTFAEAGQYALRVYLMGNDADAGATVGYTLDVVVPPAGGAATTDEVAVPVDGAATVTGVDLLNVRSGPGTENPVIGQLAGGDRVGTLSCTTAGGAGWCEIEMMTDMRERGWVASDYLVMDEAGAPAAAAAAPAATVAPAGEAGGTSEVRVDFGQGESGAILTGMLSPGESRRYVLDAGAGQDLSVSIAAAGPSISYQILNPDGSFLLDQVPAAQTYGGELWQSGDHVVEVINRGAADEGYDLAVEIR